MEYLRLHLGDEVIKEIVCFLTIDDRVRLRVLPGRLTACSVQLHDIEKTWETSTYERSVVIRVTVNKRRQLVIGIDQFDVSPKYYYHITDVLCYDGDNLVWACSYREKVSGHICTWWKRFSLGAVDQTLLCVGLLLFLRLVVLVTM